MTIFGENYASAYDFIYQDKNYEEECDFIEDAFLKHSAKVKTILDLGCGTGGHAMILAKRGYCVLGVDRSKEMLEIARRKASEANLSINFIEGDILDLSLQQKFDAVISMFAVMGYQITNKAISGVCKTAREHLSPGGIFLFDCWNGSAVLAERPAVRVKEVRINDKERIIRFTEPVLEIMTHVVETRFKMWKIREDRIDDETNEIHFMRFLFPQEIKYFLEVAGFKKTELCPFLQLEKPLTEYNWNMAVISHT